MAQFLDGIPAVDEVFLDVDNIGVGENFEEAVQRTLAKVSHVFVLIGPQWLGPAGASSRARMGRSTERQRMNPRHARRSAGTGDAATRRPWANRGRVAIACGISADGDRSGRVPTDSRVRELPLSALLPRDGDRV